MRWTKDQAGAIEARGTNLLVAAAAGSGKTSVLVERVSRLVEEGANVDEMLIVTFTRAASADMREKLRRRFSERAAQETRAPRAGGAAGKRVNLHAAFVLHIGAQAEFRGGGRRPAVPRAGRRGGQAVDGSRHGRGAGGRV